MKQFLHYVPKSLDDASSFLKANAGSMPIAGGTELLHTMKQNSLPAKVTALVDLKAISGLDTIAESGGMLKIGPNAKLTTIANSSVVKGNYAALAQAASRVASPHLRNMGTIAGNLCQDVWCWYYKGQDVLYNCIRKGGAICYAQAGDNRIYHSIFGGPKGCYAIHPSDTAVALSALNATIVTTAGSYTMDKFFSASAPGNNLAVGELIKEIDVPTPAAGSKSAFYKIAIRPSIDFALTSAGVWYTPGSGAVTDCRIYLGGVAQTPRRATESEAALKGQTISASVAMTVGQAAVANAAPMTQNGYKKQLAAVAIQRALLA
ncbi:MAG TPA: FAD binding domain-containing protein [Conexivisphaerales archaeon]|nr:FAD binding domain-containing protein [Conexivisphaerales archaeon]